MAPEKRDDVRGAPSVVTEGQTSFIDEDEGRRGRQLSGGKKELDLEHVGLAAPDSDDSVPEDEDTPPEGDRPAR